MHGQPGISAPVMKETSFLSLVSSLSQGPPVRECVRMHVRMCLQQGEKSVQGTPPAGICALKGAFKYRCQGPTPGDVDSFWVQISVFSKALQVILRTALRNNWVSNAFGSFGFIFHFWSFAF